MEMLQDKTIRGAVCGIFGNLLKNIVEFLFWDVHWLKHPLSHFAASIFVEPNHDMFFGSGLGFLMDYLYGAFLGVVFIFLISRVEEQYIQIKGLLYGSFVWFFSYSGIRALPVVKLRGAGEIDAFLEFLVHLVFGLGIGLTIQILNRYYRRSATS